MHALQCTLADRERPEVGCSARGDDLRRRRRERQTVAEFEELLETTSAVRQRALSLDLELRLGKLLPQRIVLGLDASETDVAGPPASHWGDDRRGHALNLGERPEDDRREDRDAAPGVDLRGDQDDVPDRNRQQQVADPLSNIRERHGCRSLPQSRVMQPSSVD